MRNFNLTDIVNQMNAVSFGFQDIHNRSLKALGAKFPPYNVIDKANGEMVLEFAVAGFSKEQLSVSVKGNSLLISGEAKVLDESPDEYVFLTRGISSRSFTREFTISDTVKVKSVTLVDGILTVTLVETRIEPTKTDFEIK